MQIFLFFQALLTLFIAGGIFFKENSYKNKTLSLYFLLLSFEILYFLYGTSEIGKLYPEFYGRLFYFSIGVLYGPLLYFHFKSIIGQKQQFILKDLWHLLPLLVLNVFMFDVITLSNEERIAYIENIDNFNNCIIYLNYFRDLHQIIYAFLLFRIVWLFKDRINVNEKFHLGGISIMYIITTVLITSLTFFANSFRDFSLYYIISISFVCVLGYVLFKDPNFFKAIKEKYKGARLNIEEMKTIQSKIKNELIREKIFLNNNLTLDELSLKLKVKPHHISQTLSELVKENFNDYINKHRVEHSKSLLINPSHSNYKIEAIAFDSGFNNKVTFYKAFSKFADTTPSKFRKARSKK
ncbi:helix-turn-helix domain-containing protein [Pontimicrobium sp. SW4]|uniref:Helix-turn-helix domain-containing protein n=1 Tax=Pontimicrobium sp. SW4 TaxID=3153519 RepID=A0AAU7BU63_9FLAO